MLALQMCSLISGCDFTNSTASGGLSQSISMTFECSKVVVDFCCTMVPQHFPLHLLRVKVII